MPPTGVGGLLRSDLLLGYCQSSAKVGLVELLFVQKTIGATVCGRVVTSPGAQGG
jgi:hypothetical protein